MEFPNVNEPDGYDMPLVVPVTAWSEQRSVRLIHGVAENVNENEMNLLNESRISAWNRKDVIGVGSAQTSFSGQCYGDRTPARRSSQSTNDVRGFSTGGQRHRNVAVSGEGLDLPLEDRLISEVVADACDR